MRNTTDRESVDAAERRSPRCSFCLKDWRDAGTLVEGPKRAELGAVYICRDCVEFCASIFEVEKQRSLTPQGKTAEGPIDAATREMLKAQVDQILKPLTDREREIIKLRNGLHDGYTYTVEEVGRMLKLTLEAVQEIENRAVTKLRSQNQPPLKP
jgi:RNA polymerase sigma factor (sigma-70 family)